MKFLTVVSLFALASAASAASVKRGSPLDVQIQAIGYTTVKASITNVGQSAFKVFTSGSLLDSSPLEKVQVFQGGSRIPFDGVRLMISTVNLTEADFQIIAAGETIETVFDVAELHDLGIGGTFTVIAKGALSYADSGSTKLAGVVEYASNQLLINVDGVEATKTRQQLHSSIAKRINLQSDCTSSQRTVILAALKNCVTRATRAAAAANNNTAKMTEYFKRTDATTRNTVAGVFNRIISECGSTTSGISRLFCTDIYPSCQPRNLAYTLPGSASYIVFCPLYFSSNPALTKTCHGVDQVWTTIHEMTHLTGIKGTDDYGTYEYNGVIGLSADKNINHADTYASFAKAVEVGC
ncbi:neutral protease 2-like protein [Clohesyomyces aquaticus]|uniref:Neutral protease 2 n=1 Tax=Clohesyomyces aquaticus TaxID=1231657 RepID=A0A1Y1Z401_9PLEO|nr:neutral protease 2-like protein [Clohesyomyces aquaticus]